MTTTTTTRIVIASRPSEWEQLLLQHGTAGQARFFLEERGIDPEPLVERDRILAKAISQVEQWVPTEWRRAWIRREEFATFLFEPEDIVVAVGQDGLVANLAKYLEGQALIGINPLDQEGSGPLTRVPIEGFGEILPQVVSGQAPIEERTMVHAHLDDGQSLVALNEIFVGHKSHQSARYILEDGRGNRQFQSSSGLIVSSGTGATGWASSISKERNSRLPLPKPTENRLAYFVREAWPGGGFEATLTEGTITKKRALRLSSRMEEGGVVFGDGIEKDCLHLAWGQDIQIGIARKKLRLVLS
ncbi:MAG TPA: hypothetical protein ENK02_06415 [Planctomycetes bacterium]|nr:hypothetical protein [Planctomycetota bacterium]